VIAFGKGGVTETVVPLQKTEHRTQVTDNKCPTGIFFYEQTTSALIDATTRFLSAEDTFDPCEIRKNAERFSIERFRREFRDFMEKKISDFFGTSHPD